MEGSCYMENDRTGILKSPAQIKDMWSIDGRFLLWGAAETGRKFWERFHTKIHLVGLIDSNPHIQGTCITMPDGNPANIYSWEDARVHYPDARIIITLTAFQEIAYLLRQAGFVENRDFYERRTFETLYWKYEEQQLWFSFLALVVTERCSLRCRHCIHSAPYARKPEVIPLEEHQRGCDRFFEAVDRLGRLEVMGGEALLYRPLPKLLRHIGEHYRDQIEDYTITTNGTCPLTEELAGVCRDYRIRVEISDYRNMISPVQRDRVNRFIEQLEKNQISCLLRPQDQWIDFGYQDKSSRLIAAEALTERYDRCRTICHALYRNRVYACASEIGGVSAGWCAEQPGDFVSLTMPVEEECLSVDSERDVLRDALFRLDLGLVPEGYLSYCARCRGYLSPNHVPAAQQIN